MFHAKIDVMMKKSVLDPQGKAILGALHSLGFKEVEQVRAGKHFEVELNAAEAGEADQKIRALCEKLLINPVIEEYTFSVEETGKGPEKKKPAKAAKKREKLKIPKTPQASETPETSQASETPQSPETPEKSEEIAEAS